MDSSNSSMPPSSDQKNLKNKQGSGGGSNGGTGSSKRGGKPCHKGTTLKQIKNPDRIKKILPEQCDCGSSDLRITGSYEARQEFDIEIKRVVTEYRLVHCKCGSCGKVNKPKSALPGNAFYSEKVKAYAVWLCRKLSYKS